MSNQKQKIISRNVLPIFVGGLTSILTHLGLLYLSIILFSNETEFSDLAIYLIAFVIPAMSGGFVSGYFFQKSNFIHSILAAIVFILGIIFPEICGLFRELNIIKEGDTFLLKVFSIILFAALLGSFIGIRIKRGKSII